MQHSNYHLQVEPGNRCKVVTQDIMHILPQKYTEGAKEGEKQKTVLQDYLEERINTALSL